MSKLVPTKAESRLLSLFTEEDEKLISRSIRAAKIYALSHHNLDLDIDRSDVRVEYWSIKSECPDRAPQKIESRLISSILKDKLDAVSLSLRFALEDSEDDDEDNSLISPALIGKSVLDEEIEWADRVEREQKIDSAIASHNLLYQTLSINSGEIAGRLNLTRRRINQKIKTRLDDLKDVRELKSGAQPDLFMGATV